MLSRAKIAVPPKESFGRLFQPINDLLEKIDANREESRSLAALRDALLPKLLSGELRVPATAGKLAEAHA
jgi:type I restriction enzyme S subunit